MKIVFSSPDASGGANKKYLAKNKDENKKKRVDSSSGSNDSSSDSDKDAINAALGSVRRPDGSTEVPTGSNQIMAHMASKGGNFLSVGPGDMAFTLIFGANFIADITVNVPKADLLKV